MKVFYLAAECKPFSKVGGMADVANALPPALKRRGIDVEIIIPLYETTDPGLYDSRPSCRYAVRFNGREEQVEIYDAVLDGVPVNLLRNPTYFEGTYGKPYVYSELIPFYDDVLRFSFFSKACLPLVGSKNPDIVHINDWVLGYLFGWMAIKEMPQRRVLTVHNIAYQGNIGQEVVRGWDIEEILAHESVGRLFDDPRPHWYSVNALRLAMELSDKVNTVSPNYCQEITSPEDPSRYFEGGKGLHEVAQGLYAQGKLMGILNGFPYHFSPTDTRFAQVLQEKAAMKRVLSEDFGGSDRFLLGFVGRAVEQKFRLLREELDGKSVLEHILDIPGVNIALLATGLPEYEGFLRGIGNRDNCSITIAFDRQKARQISLGSDLFLMPSLFEPCGIAQMEALSNATPPLVRWTGGLVDTVKSHTDPNGTGFGFDGATRSQLLANLIDAVIQARDLYMEDMAAFRQLQRRGFSERFLWSDTAERYIDELYT